MTCLRSCVGLLFLMVAAPLASPGTATLHHPHDPVDCLAVNPDFPEDGTIFVASRQSVNVFVVSRNGGYSWTEARSGLRGSRIDAVEFASDWRESGTVYAAVRGVGLQRSVDRGRTWEPPDILREIVHLAVPNGASPGQQIVFYATKTAVFRSDDGGRTEERIFIAGDGRQITALSVSDETHAPSLAVGLSPEGLRLSNDGGGTWRSHGTETEILDIAFSPMFGRDGTIWLATNDRGVLCSRDEGLHFMPASSGLGGERVNEVVVSGAWPDCPDLFASTPEHGVYRSRDGGATWQQTALEVPWTKQGTNHYQQLRLGSGYPQVPTVVCGTFEGVYRSDDGGDRWRKGQIKPTRIGRKLAISSHYGRDRTVLSSRYGVQLTVTMDGGESWALRCTDIDCLSAYGLGMSPFFAEDRTVMIGIEKGIQHSTDGGRTWTERRLPPHTKLTRPSYYEIRAIVYSPEFDRDRKVFAVSKGGFYASVDGGVTWEIRPPVSQYASRLAISPAFPTDATLLAGGMTLHVSTDGGRTWSDPRVHAVVKTVQFAPDYEVTREAFVGTIERGYGYTTDGGWNWTMLPEALEGFEPVSLRLTRSFHRDGTMFVTTVGGGVFRSQDRGRSFHRIHDLGSPVDHGLALAVSPEFETDRTLFVGGYDGIWRSTDAGASWTLTTDEEMYDTPRQPWVSIGRWYDHGAPGSIVSGVSQSTVKGAMQQLPFTGTGVRVLGSHGPENGIAEILLDDELVAHVDTYAPDPATQQVLYEVEGLGWGHHVIAVRVSGQHNRAAANKRIEVDAAVVSYVGPSDRAPVFASTYIELPRVTPQSRVGASPRRHDGRRGSSSSWWWVGLPLILLVGLRLART